MSFLLNQALVDTSLVRKAGASDLDWLDGGTAVAPELNRRRAVFVMGKIYEILSWEVGRGRKEKDARFVKLGEYLCEVRSNQYWRLES